MCVSPVRIKNPNYGSKVPLIVRTKDTKSQYINVPCNVCSECLASRQMQLVQRARTMALDHYIFYCTLTYDNEHLPRLGLSTGVSIPYADISDVQRMIKRIRKDNLFFRPFKFLFVSERGSERGRPHFHGLFFIDKYLDDDKLYPAMVEPSLRKVLFSQWARNVGTRKNPIYEPLFKFRQKYVGGKLFKNFDFHYVTPHTTENGSDDVSFYVTKYLLKPSSKEIRLQQALSLNLDIDEYNSAWKIVKSKMLCSKEFGYATELEKSHIQIGLELSRKDNTGLKYYCQNGNSQPLARYYRKFVPFEIASDSVDAIGSPIYDDDRTISEKLKSLEKGSIIREKIQNRDALDCLND